MDVYKKPIISLVVTTYFGILLIYKVCQKQKKMEKNSTSLRGLRPNHKTTTKREGSLPCKRCDEVFATKSLLGKHKKEVHLNSFDEKQYNYTHDKIEDTFTCNTCDAEYKNKEEIEIHILSHEKKYQCASCNEVFLSPYKYSVHAQKHTNDSFCCPLCDFKTKRVTSMLQHINRMHLKKHLYYCRHCGKGFDDSLIYKEHEQHHVSAQPIVCIVCNKEFAYSRYLTVHQTKRHRPMILGVEPKNQCPICKKIFSKDETVKRHVELRHSNKPRPKKHLCDICGKGFTIKNKLTSHYRVHTGHKPFKCSYCEKCFTQREYLVMHERIHSGVKPYRCIYCEKCFNQDASLRIHMRTHTGERPYICHLCGNGYASSSSLKIHLNNCNGFSDK